MFIWLHGPSDEDMVYGIPALDGAARVKLGTERYRAATDPDTVTRDVAASESDDLYRSHIAGRLAGIAPDCVRAEACLYTVTPDFHFLIDHALGSERVLAVSACSGHGFKHSAGLGEAVAQRLTEGRSSVDLSQFAARRFAG